MSHRGAPVLECRSLRLAGGPRVLVDDLSVAVARGEVWAILGPNGAGKSTLLQAMAGLSAAAAGEVWLDGRRLVGTFAHSRDTGTMGLREAARLRGFLPQAIRDPFAADVRDVVALGRHPHVSAWGWENGESDRCVAEALAAVDLAGFEPRDVLTLSGGERQRVAIALLLVQRPALYLLDEPVAHLDPAHQVSVLRRFRSGADRDGDAVVFSAHDPNLALRFATHAMLLDGRGAVRAGARDAVLTAVHLSACYGCPMRPVDAGGHVLFVPD